MKLLTSLLSFSVVIASQLAVVMPSRADYASDIYDVVASRFASMNIHDNGETMDYIRAFNLCMVTAYPRPNDYASEIVDDCEHIVGVIARYDIPRDTCIKILYKPDGFYPGVIYYCEKKTGQTSQSIQAKIDKLIRESK